MRAHEGLCNPQLLPIRLPMSGWLTDRLKAAEELLHAVDRTAATIGSKQRSGEPGSAGGVIAGHCTAQRRPATRK